TTQYNASPSNTIVNAAINNPGVAFYNYRGYIGMSGWPATMSAMFNSSRLFHAVFITCDTGSFDEYEVSTTEAVIRYGTSASLGGAITAIGMATSATHTSINNCLDMGIFHGIYNKQMRDMGSSLLHSKLYLYSVYGVSNPSAYQNFTGYCNLMGAPQQRCM
ncbi:MAG: C25 family cysteine peptidase, partial [Candidatus Cloacimonetes bacterium]|nr:C25 family cysteine peptidase [Candidatus Cloacimonadota bacterium]